MDRLQGGYYPLRTPEGAENGYLCLNFLTAGLEILVAMDRAPATEAGFEGCFTEHLAVKPSGVTSHFPATSGDQRYRARCVVALDKQIFPARSCDYTLFSKGRPIASAVLYDAPEPEVPESEEPELETPEETQTEAVSAQSTKTPPEKGPITFTPFDPFNTTNDAYEWWICQNNEDFHQLMVQTGLIPHPPLYSALQSALVRFGHFLFGSYTEEKEGRVLFILGVPGMESSPQDSGNARWIPAQNKITGATNYTGYGLHYFDAQTGKAVRAVIRQ